MSQQPALTADQQKIKSASGARLKHVPMEKSLESGGFRGFPALPALKPEDHSIGERRTPDR